MISQSTYQTTSNNHWQWLTILPPPHRRGPFRGGFAKGMYRPPAGVDTSRRKWHTSRALTGSNHHVNLHLGIVNFKL